MSGQNTWIYHIDIDSFIINTKTENVTNDAEKRFSTSNYEVERPLPIGIK